MENLKYIPIVLFLFLFSACEKDLMDYKGGDRIQFSGDTLVTKSFIFDDASKVSDTIWVGVQTLGNLSDTDRRVAFAQVTEKEWVFTYDDDGNKKDSTYVDITNGAIEGTHFSSLSDPSIQSRMIIKADSTTAKIPIVVLRNASLKINSVRLKIKIIQNDFFDMGEREHSERVIVITDKFTKPTTWNSTIDYYFGNYGPVKHKFMYDVTGLIIDDDFVDNLYLDSSLRSYYRGLFKVKLKEYNDSHPDDPLREEPLEGQSEGELVTFG
jgi:hypothetical protein